MFFSDNSRVSINSEQGIVRLSIKSSDYSVDEFTIPFSEFDSFADSAQQKQDFSSDNIKIKWLARDAILQIRESRYKRRIFKFSEVKIGRIVSAYLSEKITYLDYLSKNKGTVHEFTEEYLYDSDALMNIGKEIKRQNEQMSKDLENKIDQLLNICMNLSTTCIKLDKGIQGLSEKISEIEFNNFEQVVIQSGESVDDGLFISDDQEQFIPSDINVDFSGSMSAQSTETSDNAMDAVNALKKLRGGKDE